MDKEKDKDQIPKDSHEERIYIMDLLKEMFSIENGNEEEYIDIDYGITSFKDCFVKGYDNVVDIERYRLYKIYKND